MKRLQSGWGGKPEVQTIRRLVTESEVAVAGNINSASWGLMPSRQRTAHRFVQRRRGWLCGLRALDAPCWKNSRLSLNTFGKRRLGMVRRTYGACWFLP
ncbi:hypothetical protein ECP03052937_5311 [Escherichia coli p0305293.7]|nr:hypothetical protein ECP03052937_5311 [Escherichia coli p0305293.7]